MRNALIYTLTIISLFFLRPTGRAQETDFTPFHTHYRILNNNNGLSNSSVTAILQDQEGMMWFGTWDGLNRYDGKRVVQYRHLNGDKHTLSHPVVRHIAEEDVHHLWITTDFGICQLDKRAGTFTRYFLDYKQSSVSEEKFFSCDVSPQGQVAACYQGSDLYIYNKEKGNFEKRALSNGKSIHAQELFFDQVGDLWVIHDGKFLSRISLQGNTIRIKNTIQVGPWSQGKILYDGQNHIWTEKGGVLYNINIMDKQPKFHPLGIQIPNSLNTVCADDGGLIHIGTTRGSYLLSNDKLMPSSIQGVTVMSLFCGTQDVTWVGTDGRGVFQETQINDLLSTVPSNQILNNPNSPIRAILRQSDGNLWIGSKGGGLTLIQANGEKHNYEVGNDKSLNSVFALCEGHNGIWVGTDGAGLQFMDIATHQLTYRTMPNGTSTFNLGNVYCVVYLTGGVLWVGTSGNGLFRLTLDQKNQIVSMQHYQHNDKNPNSLGSNIVYSILPDRNYLWVATRGGGLSQLDIRTGKCHNYTYQANSENSICSNDVISLSMDSQGRLWIGTTSGLSLYSIKEDKFRNYTEADGLPNTNIHAILQDYAQNTWVSTSRGLACFDHRTERIIPYFYADGLQDNEFSDGAAYADPNGTTLYFGGISGYNILRPLSLKYQDFMPALLLTDITREGKPYCMDGNLIKCRYSENTLELNFSILDYNDNDKCQFEYRIVKEGIWMKGKESPWIRSNERNIVLSGLSAGDYKLEVHISNAAQEWSDPTTYRISISSPWWLSWWAFIIYVLLLSVVIYKFYRTKRGRLIMRHELELEKQEKLNKEEVHQAKLRFFTNIAHEFSNSITLIYGAVEQILASQNVEGPTRKQLVAIHHNAERMHRQIQELMEFRKAETGHLHLQLQLVDITELVSHTADNFLNAAESRNITMTTEISPEVGQWVVDRSKTEKIVFNLLSNAMKYAPTNGNVLLKTDITAEHMLRISCTNDGPGIKPENLKNVFNRFSVLDNFEQKLSQGMYSRNGIGLAMCQDLTQLMGGEISVESVVNEHTTFTVLLPHHPADAADVVVPTIQEKEKEIPEEEEKQSETNSIFENQRPLVLVVDDQHDICDLICEILSKDYETITAYDGKEALEKIQDELPALIISDILMPQMNGFELLQSLKASERTSYIPVILLSSKSDTESRIEAMETGANLFLHKPFHPRYLKASVDSLMQSQSRMRHFSESTASYKENYHGSMLSREEREFMDRLIDTLDKHYSQEEYDQDALAADLALSRMQLYRRLKTVAQTTPGQFIRSYRMHQAEKLLIQSDKTIQEIAISCGFHNKSYFHRLFMSEHNCSPGEYREQHRKS